MAEAQTLSKLLVPGDTKAINATDKHKRARKIVDLIFSIDPGTPKRWRAIWRLWLTMKPITHYREHRLTIEENKIIRSNLIDKKHGKSMATIHKGRDWDGKQVQHLNLLGNMPESLYDMLKRFDPLGLGLARGSESHRMKRQLYREFKEYKLPEIV